MPNNPFQIVRSPTQHNRKRWEVFQGSAKLGSFWMGNGTIYAHTTNQPGKDLVEQLRGNDIGLMETSQAGQWVYDRYHENRAATN